MKKAAAEEKKKNDDLKKRRRCPKKLEDAKPGSLLVSVVRKVIKAEVKATPTWRLKPTTKMGSRTS